MADVRIQQYPLKSIVSDNDIFLIADSNDVDVNGFLKYKKVRAKDLPSIVNTAESITYANLMASIAANDLIIGTFYKITDSTSGVSPLLVQAIGVDAIGYLAFDASNPLVTINYDVMTDTIRWSKNETAAPISLGSLSATTPLSYNNTTGVFTISQSNTTTNGYLSSADWNTFTAKQNAGNYITALTGEATASGPVGGGSAAITLDNTAVIGKVLSGLNVTGGNVVSTDSILTAFGKTQNQINALVGGVMFQGVWDAATNNPALTSSVGTKGYYYVVNVAGSTNLNGITDWKVGDWAIFDGTAWQKVDNTDSVSSVFGRVGAVVATEGDYSLTQLSDVTLSSPSNGQVLKYNGTAWVNGTDIDTGLTSVGLTMPSAFSVANSPLTANGTLAVTGAGVASQYVRGDGTLAAFPTTTGGGSSVSYYFNGGTNQGTIGGNTYYEMSTTAVIGTGADFNINANGYIAQFVTDANDPSLLSIPAGNWNFEMWFSASSGGGSPSFYLELYKYDGATLTLISSGSANPELITGGTAIDLYTTALAVPLTTLTVTDRLAVRVYVTHSSKTITLHTQNGHLCQAITTFSTGLTALNGLTSQVQYLAVGSSGTDFGISSATSTHTFNLPTASAANRGALSSADWTTFNNKQNALTNPITGTGTTNYLPKFTGASALGDSAITDDGTTVTLVSRPLSFSANTSAAAGSISRNATYGLTLFGVAGLTYDFGLVNKDGNQVMAVPTGTINTFFSGNVGIGTLSPAYTLDVNGTGRFAASYTASGTVAIETWQRLGGAVSADMTYNDGSTSMNFGTSTSHTLNIKTNNTTALSIASSGAATFSVDATINGVRVGKGAGNIASNTAVGFESLINNTTGAYNTVLGLQSGRNNNTGGENTFIGEEVGFNNQTGSRNSYLGAAAGYINVTGNNNTAIGHTALFFNTASNNTAVGFEAARGNTSGLVTAIGYQALRANTTGENCAIGYIALLSNTTGTNNTAIGNYSLYQNSIGNSNTAIGRLSLGNNTTGGNNTAVGFNTQSGNFEGSVILGYDAAATGNNQFVVGSASVNAGTIATEVVVSDTTWAVRINGTAYKILLKA